MKEKRRSALPLASTHKPQTSISKLIQAVKTGDAIAAHAQFEQLCKEARFTQASILAVKQELNAMGKSALGQQSTDWDNRRLLTLIDAMEVETNEGGVLARL
jgi:hypothetical protein